MFEWVCFTRWNGDILRNTFITDARDREMIAWRALVSAGIGGSDIREMMLEGEERRFSGHRAPSVIEMLSYNSLPHISKNTPFFSWKLGLKP